MAIVKHLLALAVVLAFVAGSTAQLVPPSMAQMDIGTRADTGGGCNGPKTPCTGDLPSCIDHIGCPAVSALPAAPEPMPISFRWSLAFYDFAAARIAGLTIEPELSPPILAA